MQSPEPSTGDRLRAIHAEQRTIREELATLTLRDEDGNVQAVAPLGARWQPLPGREGVRIFHVPHPDGLPGLFLTVSVSEAGSHYEGSVLDESRLLGLIEGDITLNSKPYTPGQFLWLAPGEPSSWRTRDGAVCVVRYNTPPPDLDLSDIIQPVKP